MVLGRSTDVLCLQNSAPWRVFRAAFVPQRWHSGAVRTTNGPGSSDRHDPPIRTKSSFDRSPRRGVHVHRQRIARHACDKESYAVDTERLAIAYLVCSNETEFDSLTLMSPA